MHTCERTQVAAMLRRIYERHLTTSTGGNVSVRCPDGVIAITPSGIDKATVTADQVALLQPDGANLTPTLRPSSEGKMHLAIYAQHPAVQAVVHAHPPTASLFACSATPIDLGLLCETYALLDPPVKAPYALSGSDELALVVAEYAGRSCAILLENHAVLTTGQDLMQAFQRLELLEGAARATLAAAQLSNVRRLTDVEKRELDRLVGRPHAG